MTNEERELPPEIQRLIDEDKAKHVKHLITLVNGPADGGSFEVPDGVMSVTVTVDHHEGELVYLRSAEDPLTFKHYDKK